MGGITGNGSADHRPYKVNQSGDNSGIIETFSSHRVVSCDKGHYHTYCKNFRQPSNRAWIVFPRNDEADAFNTLPHVRSAAVQIFRSQLTSN
jgi:hypothetical protein